MLIDAAEARYSLSSEPTLLIVRGEQAHLLGIFDGTGSWGAGNEAASWSRNSLEARWLPDIDALTAERLEGDLLDLPTQLPDDFVSEDFGCSFSVALCLVRSNQASIVASGLFSVILVGPESSKVLHRPRMLTDDLLEKGDLSPADLGSFPHRNVVVGPFVGDGTTRSLTNEDVHIDVGETLIVGHRELADVVLQSGAHSVSGAVALQSLSPERNLGPSATITISRP